MATLEEVQAFLTDPVLQRRLAKYMVLECFRNSTLEDLHSGISPSSVTGDYSDVTVISPYGVIPWPKVSRLNDEEMKRLMIDVVDRAYRFIHTLFDENTSVGLLVHLAERDPVSRSSTTHQSAVLNLLSVMNGMALQLQHVSDLAMLSGAMINLDDRAIVAKVLRFRRSVLIETLADDISRVNVLLAQVRTPAIAVEVSKARDRAQEIVRKLESWNP